MKELIGPFSQLLTMDHLPAKGPIVDQQLEVILNAGIVIEHSKIYEIDRFDLLQHKYHHFHKIEFPSVAIPGIIDAHTHICFAGSRAADYALRVSGESYLTLAEKGKGILETVAKTREASLDQLVAGLLDRTKKLLALGITTCEIKSGYGLAIEDEIKMLEAIKVSQKLQPVDLIPTCLAAHTLPPEFSSNEKYLGMISESLFPLLQQKKLTNRIDIFVDKTAFSVEEARRYLQKAKKLGFSLCLHADQFSRGGSRLAAELKALSADHLEQSLDADFTALKHADVIPILLPGASLGLGVPMPPARKMVDAGLPIVIASDWNPGSAPMGNLLLQAAVLGAFEKLTIAETFSAITQRAATALSLNDRGILRPGMRADMAIFPCSDYREIFYQQGGLTPKMVMVKGAFAWT